MRNKLLPVVLGITSALLLVLFFGRIRRNNNFFEKTFRQDSEVLASSNTQSPEHPNSVFSRFLPELLEKDNISKQKAFQKVLGTVQEKTGTYSIYVKNLKTQDIYTLNENEIYFGASLYKTPLAIATMHAIEVNALRNSQSIAYTPADFSSGTGVIQTTSYYTTYTVDQLLSNLLKYSDNIAQNMLARSISDGYELDAYLISTKDPTIGSSFYNEDEVNAINAAYTYEFLYRVSSGLEHSEFISSESAQSLLDLLSATSFEDRISLGLSETTTFSHKIGNWGEEGSWHDCGLAKTKESVYTVCLMSRNTTFEDVQDVAKDLGEFIEF